jgi:hypothetical protein
MNVEIDWEFWVVKGVELVIMLCAQLEVIRLAALGKSVRLEILVRGWVEKRWFESHFASLYFLLCFP